ASLGRSTMRRGRTCMARPCRGSKASSPWPLPRRSLPRLPGGSIVAHTREPGGSMTPLERIQSLKMPFAELKGVTFTEADKDRVVAKMQVRPELCTLFHTIHGGAIMAFADS